MAQTPHVTLNRVHFQWPDGRLLFDNLDETFDAALVGIVGRNGSGKSTLGALIAGDIAPTRGRIERRASVWRVTQQVADPAHGSIAALAGLTEPLQALQRLNRGEGSHDDLACLGERWDLDRRWHDLLRRAGLAADNDDATAISSGQRRLVALLGAFCSRADLLVLDEPGNHLDHDARLLLGEEIRQWQASGRGLVLISHDRELLAQVDRIVELRHDGVHRHGGGWAHFEAQRRREIDAASERLALARQQRRQLQDALQRERERADKRNARGTRERHSGSQSKLLLNIQRERADHSEAARVQRHAWQREQMQQQVRAAWRDLGDALERPAFPALPIDLPAGHTVLRCDALVAPWGWSEPLDWVLRGPARIAIEGRNGSGKSTLLRLIAGALTPHAGRCEAPRRAVLLDPSLSLLDPARSLCAQLTERAPRMDTAEARRWLAIAGIDADQALRPSATLSGGERLRGALLVAICTQPTPQLLLLDEPTNALDIDAVEALASMLDHWRGALIVASHDAGFLSRLRIDGRLARHEAGWRFTPAAVPGD